MTFNVYERVAPGGDEDCTNTSQVKALGETNVTSVDDLCLWAAEENGKYHGPEDPDLFFAIHAFVDPKTFSPSSE